MLNSSLLLKRSQQPQKVAFLSSISMTLQAVSIFLFFAFIIFTFKIQQNFKCSITTTKIFRLQGVFMPHRGEDKREMDNLLETAIDAMQQFSLIQPAMGHKIL